MNDGDLERDASFQQYLQTCPPAGLLYIGSGELIQVSTDCADSPKYHRINEIHQAGDEPVRRWVSTLSADTRTGTGTAPDCSGSPAGNRIETDSVSEEVSGPPAGDGHKVRLMTVMDLSAADPLIRELLGKATRLFPECLLVACYGPQQQSTGSLDALFFSYGFQRLAGVSGQHVGHDQVRWYEYRMSVYKTPPDWLNARFWANPQRFDVIEDPDLYSEEE